jgi:hypothetical protein
MMNPLTGRRLGHQRTGSGVWMAMPSTVIRRFDYQPERQELVITFTSGRRYLYEGVPEEEARKFRSAFSKGIYFNRHIRDRYPCRTLDPVS